MHVDIQIKTEKHGLITIMYDGVQNIETDYSMKTTLYLAEGYSAKCLHKDWYENNIDLRPFIYTYHEVSRIITTKY